MRLEQILAVAAFAVVGAATLSTCSEPADAHDALPSFESLRAVPAVVRPGASDGLAAYRRIHDAPTGWSYPLSCCSGYDCRQVDESAIDEGPAGYTIRATGETIPMTDAKVKPSPDGLFHWCSVGGQPDGRTICLFVPPRGF